MTRNNSDRKKGFKLGRDREKSNNTSEKNSGNVTSNIKLKFEAGDQSYPIVFEKILEELKIKVLRTVRLHPADVAELTDLRKKRIFPTSSPSPSGSP
jgi:hypothetical protein